jgi:hypothetical protein
MDTPTLQRSAISPLRLVMLFGMIVGNMVLLAVIAGVGFAEWPLVTATLWHMRNGNTVELEGHTFHVPRLYEPEVSKGGKEIDILKDPRMFGGGAAVMLGSNPKVLDLGAANRWQAALIAPVNHNRHNIPQSLPLTLHGKKLTFVCVDLAMGGALICRAPGTSLTAATWASSPTQIQETRMVLETSD